MANIWVTKSGSDANPGTPDSPKLTITAAVTGAANGDVIYVGTGIYAEHVNYRATPIISITIQASGLVIIDAENVRAHCVTGPNGAAVQTVRGIIFRNALDELWDTRNLAGADLVAEECEFLNARMVKENGPITMRRCVVRNIHNTADAAIINTSVSLTVEFQDCLFDNCSGASGLVRTTGSSTLQPILYRNIISRVPGLAWNFTSLTSPISQSNFNFYDHGMHFRRGGTVFANLTAWQAQGTLADPNSVSGSPEFVDPDKALFAPLPAGNLTRVAPNAGLIGPYRVALGLSTNRNSNLWTSGAHENTSFDASGNLFLVDSVLLTGAYTLETLDLGAVLRVRAIRISTLFETVADTVDADINDLSPFGHLTIEYRSSTTSKSDAESQGWSKVRRFAAGQINFPPNLNARWVQIRLTLRSNGVAV